MSLSSAKVWLSPKELNSISSRYGSQYAQYFQFSNIYTYWLTALSLVGVVSHLTVGRFSIIFTTINILFGLVLSKLIKINATNSTKTVTAKKVSANVTLKKLSFVPISFLFTASIVLIQMFCFVLEITVNEIYEDKFKQFLSLAPTAIICIATPIIVMVYKKIVLANLKWEGSITNIDDVSGVTKLATINFVTSYVPLFISALVYLPFGSNLSLIDHVKVSAYGEGISAFLKQRSVMYNTLSHHLFEFLGDYPSTLKFKAYSDFVVNNERLVNQYYYFIVTNQVIQLVFKVLPLVLSNFKQVSIGLNLVDCYRSTILQFGYLAIFGPIWPLAPLICLAFHRLSVFVDTITLSKSTAIYNLSNENYNWDKFAFALCWVGSIAGPLITAMFRNGIPQFNVYNYKSDLFFYGFILFASEHAFFIVNYISDLFVSGFVSSNSAGTAAAKSSLSHSSNSSNSEKSLQDKLDTLEKTRQKIIQNKREIEELKQVKANSDKVIVSNEGKLATIDDNSHFTPDEDDDVEILDGDDVEKMNNIHNSFDDEYEANTTSPILEEDESENDLSTGTGANTPSKSGSDKVNGVKKRSIKKLFRSSK